RAGRGSVRWIGRAAGPAVERIVAAVYVRTRRAGAPAVEWASSPPDFSRLLAGAAGSRRLHPPPPWWISFRWYAGPWWAVWDEDYETVRNEVAAAAAAGVGIGVGEAEELVSDELVLVPEGRRDRPRAPDRDPRQLESRASQRRRT